MMSDFPEKDGKVLQINEEEFAEFSEEIPQRHPGS
jgi:hypothetical protein